MDSSRVERITQKVQYFCFTCLGSIKDATLVFRNPQVITLLKSHILFSFGCLVCDISQVHSCKKCFSKDFKWLSDRSQSTMSWIEFIILNTNSNFGSICQKSTRDTLLWKNTWSEGSMELQSTASLGKWPAWPHSESFVYGGSQLLSCHV